MESSAVSMRSRKPIADYAMIGDCHSAALVGRDGSIDWWCAPRFDSPSLFGSLLDDAAGYFELAPADGTVGTRAYVEGTLVLQTTFRTPHGRVVITDALALGDRETGHSIGYASPGELIRYVRCEEGRVAMAMRIAARPEYGAIEPVVTVTHNGAIVRGGAERLVVSSSEPLVREGSDVSASFTLAAGGEAVFAVSHTASSQPAPKFESTHHSKNELRSTIKGWQTWSRLHQSYEGSYRERVHFSGRVLQSLTYQPTGAMVAAPTTSLPETIGGSLNWDYRYTWLRDASMTLDALWISACPDEAERYFSFLAHAGSSRARGGRLQIVYGIGGEHDLTERELPHLSGWRGSAPVRIGNGAWTQNQNDVYGAIVAAARRFENRLERFDELTRAFVVDAIEAAATCWQSPDAGIWEIRGESRRFVHSAAMCWIALDGGAAIAEALGVADRAERWRGVRDAIADAIHTNGWSDVRHSYVQAFDDPHTLDASVLILITSGFLDAGDARAHATVETIARELADARGLIRRYDGVDEGAFLLCTFWLAEAQAILGDLEVARATLDRVAGFANDVGLFSEEVDSHTGSAIGNFPQAFSHLGFVNAAAAIDARTQSPAPQSGRVG